MVDVRSEKKEVKVERREHPRLEIHCDTTIPGLKGIHTLTDISFGGCFIEAKIPGKVKIGQIINLKTKLPTETKAITVKAKIVSQKERGIGCQFISLQDEAKDAICLCFEMFKDTLPAGTQEAQWEKECVEAEPEVLPTESKKKIERPPASGTSDSRTRPGTKQSPAGELSDTTSKPRTKQSHVREESVPTQKISAGSSDRRNFLLKVGVGLIVVSAAGYFLVSTVLHTPSDPEPKAVIYQTAVPASPGHTTKAQAYSDVSIDAANANQSQHVQTPASEELQRQNHDAELPQGQSISPGKTKDIESEPDLGDHDETSGTVDLAEDPDLESNASMDQRLVKSEAENGLNTPAQELFSIEIGPIFSKNKLNQAVSILQQNGLDPEMIIEMETMKVVRLLEGSYARDRAQKRLKEIQKVIDSAFVIPEKGKFSIYVATYYDRDKAIQKSKELAKNNIKVTAVSAGIKRKGTKLIVTQAEQPQISAVQDQISKMGLSLAILKNG